MADFGWAFVKGNLLTGSAGPSGSIQYNDGNGKLSGSGDFTFVSGATSQLNLTGNLDVVGELTVDGTASFNNNINFAEDISLGVTKRLYFDSQLSPTGQGPYIFAPSYTQLVVDGDDYLNLYSDTETRLYVGSGTRLSVKESSITSSVDTRITQDLYVEGQISGATYIGDGSGLSNVITDPAGSDHEIQFNDNGVFGASSNLTFDGSTLRLTGALGLNSSLFFGTAKYIYFNGVSGPTQGPYLLGEPDRLFIDGKNMLELSGDDHIKLFATSSAIPTLDLRPNGITSSVDMLISGSLTVSGTINANELNINVVNRDVINISSTGSTKFGDSSDDTHVFTGSMYVGTSVSSSTIYGTVISASNMNLTGIQAGTPPNTSSYLALDSNYNLVLTSAAGGGGVASGVIGEAEDGDYTDGLFSDFLASTPIGTAIDKFNEILKIIVPGPAPAVDRINYTNTSGIETKLSFKDQVDAPTDYVDVGTTGSFSSDVLIDEQYTVATSGEDFRLGVYDGAQEITGVINFHVVEQLKTSEVNYSHDAFGNAESGSLKLYLNGVELHSFNLTASGAGNPNSGSASDLNSSGSGFFDISITASATDQNGSEYDIFQHRTAKYVIDPQDQNKGWNYAQIKHEYGSTTYTTNYIQWFNDSDALSEAMTPNNPEVVFTGNGSKYLSGVQYFRSASLVYTAEVENFYKYTYPTGNVLTFNTSSNLDNISPSGAAPTDGTDLYNKIFQITASTETNNDIMLNDSATISFNLSHPLKTNLTTTGSIATNNILIYNVDTVSTNTIENFDSEDFRLLSGNYSTQVSASNSGNAWDSENHMTSSGATGHTDGLLMYNGALLSPKQGVGNGRFNALTNGPTGNPDYSTITGTRTFYRKIQNTSGGPIRDLKIITEKSSRINNSSLTTNNVQFYLKIPGTTGWMDISQNFTYGAISDGDGALINGASDNSNTGATSTGDSDHCVTFGTASVANNDYVVIKILADATWTGNIDSLQFQLGASDTNNAATPDSVGDLNLSNNGVDANLSFGSSNIVSGYSNVTGGLGSMSPVDSNALYADDSDDKRGVFSSFEVMTGLINPTASAGANDAFYNGYTGSLVLEINGAEYGAIDLAANRNASSSISSGTGLSVTAVAESLTSDNIPDYTLHYRTGSYSVGTSDQRLGWNYARVIHRVGGVDTTTSYVEWVVDTSSSNDNTAVSIPTLTNFGHTDVYYQSGIGYFASNPTASFSFTGSNFYNNVYSDDSSAISFPTRFSASINSITGSGTGLTTRTAGIPATSMDLPLLNNTDDCETTDIVVTASLTYTGGTSINDGLGLFNSRNASISGKLKHPIKTDRTTLTATKSSFMRYSGSLGSTNLNTLEYFGNETYRVVSGNYVSQSNVTSSSNSWNSQYSVNDGVTYPAYNDGMVTVNGYAISPLNIGNAGDTRNAADGGSLQAPDDNPNYSTLSESVRTYYRYFRNETGLSKATFTVSLEGDANLVSKSGAFYTGSLGANKNINVELKVPFDPAFTGLDDTSTAWGDCIRPYEGGTQPDTDGVGIFNGGGSDLDQTVDSQGADIAIQLQGRQVRDDQYFVLKISAHEDWTGYLSRIAITY